MKVGGAVVVEVVVFIVNWLDCRSREDPIESVTPCQPNRVCDPLSRP